MPTGSVAPSQRVILSEETSRWLVDESNIKKTAYVAGFLMQNGVSPFWDLVWSFNSSPAEIPIPLTAVWPCGFDYACGSAQDDAADFAFPTREGKSASLPPSVREVAPKATEGVFADIKTPHPLRGSRERVALLVPLAQRRRPPSREGAIRCSAFILRSRNRLHPCPPTKQPRRSGAVMALCQAVV